MARVAVKPSLAGPLARLRKLNAALAWINKRIPPIPKDYYKNWGKYNKDKVWKAAKKERAGAFKVKAGLNSVMDEQRAIVRALKSKTGVTVGEKEDNDD